MSNGISHSSEQTYKQISDPFLFADLGISFKRIYC